jgi:hypothetical protein
MDHARDLTQRRGGPDERVDRLARGDVDRGGTHLEPGLVHYLRGRGCVLPQKVREHDLLADAARLAMA